MKIADSAVINLLAAGQVQKAEMWRFELASGTVLRLTDHDAPVTVDVADDAFGAVLWSTGMLFERGNVLQRVGMEVQTLSLRLTPQFDHPSGPPITLASIRNRLLDGARITLFKCFTDQWLTPLRPVHWFQGRVSDVELDRMSAYITIQSDLELLNVAMPRNIVQQGCIWTLFGPGCDLSPASFTFARTVTATGPNTISTFTTNDAHADTYFALGKATFTTGPNAGLTRPVRSSLATNGRITCIVPFPNAPGTGDAVTLIAGCDKRQSTCSSKFSNLGRFRGYPYVPVPETLYDGGAAGNTAAIPTLGSQGGTSAGSDPGSRLAPRRSFSF